MITKEALEKRIIALEEAKQQHLANANATSGAIQEARLWLGEIDKPEVKEPEPTDSGEEKGDA